MESLPVGQRQTASARRILIEVREEPDGVLRFLVVEEEGVIVSCSRLLLKNEAIDQVPDFTGETEEVERVAVVALEEEHVVAARVLDLSVKEMR